MDLIPGAYIGGKYELKRALASGGMGSLWVARHTELFTDVAIKFISEAYAGSSLLRSRFVREARAAAHIVSNNVVRVHDYGVEDGTPYLVMELLRGEDLGVRLKRVGRLPLADVACIFTQLAVGLRRAHKAGFVHRDLKPSNVFLARSDDDEEEEVKLLDFGVAKETDAARSGAVDEFEERTKTGEIMGSPHYMSPEQIHESKDIDARSDLWSLAVILFRALTGELPFPGDAAGPVMSKILTDPIPAPSEYVTGLPRAVDAFFERAFQRDPERRFQSATEMAAAFAEAAGARAGGGALVGSSVPTFLRKHLRAPMSSCPTPSSTLPAPGAPPVDGTLRCAEMGASAVHVVARGRRSPPLGGEGGADDEPPCASGTLSASSIAVLGAARAARRPPLPWLLGAAGAVGVAVGWIFIGVFINPKGSYRPEPPPSVELATIAPLAPAFSIAAPLDPAPEAVRADVVDDRRAPSKPSKPSGAPEPTSRAIAPLRPAPAPRSPPARPQVAAAVAPAPSSSPPVGGPAAPRPMSSGFALKPLRLGF